MNKRIIFVFLIIFLIGGKTMAQSRASFEDEALMVNLATGLSGANLQVSDLNPPKSFSSQIDLANTGRYDVIIEVAYDPTGWKLLQWFIKNEQTLNLEEFNVQWDILQECSNQTINRARKSNIHTLLEELGLKSNRVFVRSKSAEEVYIKVYVERAPWVKPVEDNRLQIDSLSYRIDSLKEALEQLTEAPDTSIINQTANSPDWIIGVGSEATLVDDKFIVVPTVSIIMAQQNNRFIATGGYFPGDEVDKKFLAMSFAHFPEDHKLGLVVRASYASEATDKGYISKGLNVAGGGIYQNNKFGLHLTVGVQYFDNQYQRPSFKPTINLGVNFNILSF